MTRLRMLARAVVLAMVTWMAHAAPLAAQAGEPSAEDRAAAQGMMQAGVAAAQDGDWEAARIAFQRAYALVASTRVLMNLAGAQRHTGRLLEARASYQRWLSDATDRDASFRATIEEELRAVESEIPQVVVTLHGAIPGDRVELDGHEVMAGEATQVDPGEHVVEVMRDGSAVRTERFTLSPNDWHEVDLTLAAPERPSAAVTTPPRSLIAERPHEDIVSSPWLWVGVGAGAALVIGIIVGVAVASSGPAPAPMPDTGTFGPFRL